MTSKKGRKGFLCLVLVMVFVGMVSAVPLTGSIGNARMILKAETGDEIEKYVFVENVNNVSVDVEIFASGDLVDDINIKDDKFSLGPGENKNAYFTVKARDEGTTESRINVQFAPSDGGNGVGLTSTVIVITKEGGGWFDWGNEDSGDDVVVGDGDDKGGVSVTNNGGSRDTGEYGLDEVGDSLKDKVGLTGIFIFVTGFMLVAFVFLTVFALRSKRKFGGEGIGKGGRFGGGFGKGGRFGGGKEKIKLKKSRVKKHV